MEHFDRSTRSSVLVLLVPTHLRSTCHVTLAESWYSRVAWVLKQSKRGGIGGYYSTHPSGNAKDDTDIIITYGSRTLGNERFGILCNWSGHVPEGRGSQMNALSDFTSGKESMKTAQHFIRFRDTVFDGTIFWMMAFFFSTRSLKC